MSTTSRVQLYKDARRKMERVFSANGQPLDGALIINYLSLIKDDVLSSSQATRLAAIDTFKFLIGIRDVHTQSIIMKFTEEQSGNEVLQKCLVGCLQRVILKAIEGDEDFIGMLQIWMPYHEKIIDVVEETCKSHLPPDKCKHLFLDIVISTLMSQTLDADLRTLLIDLAFRLSTVVPITSLSPKELQTFLWNFGNKYVDVIEALRVNSYSSWHRMWMFLVRYCGKNLHHSMELTNKLLRIVEYAFRNANHVQRIRGYDCWKELIDNASLDRAYITSNKQMKLLTTPLKAKFSKQDVVICKRFDVFCYLLNKLQDKAVICLNDFLDFCFGPVVSPEDSSKVGPVKGVAALWVKSASALADILGHYHKENCGMENMIHFERPILDSTNFESFCSVVLNSILECCILLINSNDTSDKEKIMKCLWESTIRLIAFTDKDGCTDKVVEILEMFIKRSEGEALFRVLRVISTLLLVENEIPSNAYKLFKPLWKVVLVIENIPSDSLKQFILKAFSNTQTVEEKIKMVKDVMKEMVQAQINDHNVNTLYKVWFCLAKEIASEFSIDKLKEFENFNGFFLWPAYNLHVLEESDRKQTVLFWMKLYRKVSADFESKKLDVFKDLEKIFRNNPLLASNICTMVNIMSQVEVKPSKEFASKLMEIVSSILELPNLKNEDEQKVMGIILQYFDHNMNIIEDEEVLIKICNVIKHDLSIHKGYRILESFCNFLRRTPSNIKALFSKQLSDLLHDLYRKQSDTKGYPAKEIQKVMVLFEEGEGIEKKTFVAPAGRSARIAHLAKKSPKSPVKVQPTSPASLRLFGKDIDTMSPLKVKGSQLNNTPTRKSQKAANIIEARVGGPFAVDDDSASKFVPIQSEVKFEPSKLSEHQREALKRRRDDIPALYQDLSQSQSQDFSSRSNSNTPGNSRPSTVVEEFYKENESKETKNTQKSEDLFGDAESSDAPVEAPKTDIQVVEGIFAEEGKIQEYNTSTERERGTTSDRTISTEVNAISNGTFAKVDDKMSSEEQRGKAYEDVRNVKEPNISQKVIVEQLPTPEQFFGEVIREPVEASSRVTDMTSLGMTEKNWIPTDETEEEKKKRRIEAELAKLRMDIVGADEYLASSRRRRQTQKKEDEDRNKSRRKSLSGVEKPKKCDEKRRKSISGSASEMPLPNSPQEETLKQGIENDHEVANIAIEHPVVNVPVANEANKPSRKKQKEKVEGAETLKAHEYHQQAPKKGGRKKRTEQKQQLTPTSFDSDIFVKNLKRRFVEKVEHVVAENSITTDEVVVDLTDNEQKIHEHQDKEEGVNICGKSPKRKSKKKAPEESEEITAHQTTSPSTDGPISSKSPKKKIKRKEENEIVNPQDISAQNEEECIAVKSLKKKSKKKHREENSHTDNLEAVIVFKDSSDHRSSSSPECEEGKSFTIRFKRKNSASPKQKEVKEHKPEEVNRTTAKRKLSLDDEDVIESSQDSYGSITSLSSTSKRRRLDETEDDTMVNKPSTTAAEGSSATLPENQDCVEAADHSSSTTIDPCPSDEQSTTAESTLTHESSEDSLPLEITEEPKTEKLPDTQETLTQVTQPTQDTVSDVITKAEEDKVQELYFELPQKPQLTESEQMMCKMDTMSVCLSSNPEAEHHQSLEEVELTSCTPEKKKHPSDGESTPSTNSIICSPVTDDTPQKNCELLTDTVNISPISPQSTSTSESVDMVVAKEITFDGKRTNNDDVFEDEGAVTEERCWSFTPPEMVLDVISHPEEEVKEEEETKSSSTIHERPIKFRGTANIKSPMPHRKFVKRVRSGVKMSPSTGRIMKLMSNFNYKPVAEKNEEGDLKEDDLLTFSREVPSPLAVPRSSILKRKLSDSIDSDGFSPAAKRKRVNFSDPCLTSKKLFIKDEDYQLSAEVKSLFDVEPTSSDALDKLFSMSDSDDNDSENINTEQSLEMVNPASLRKDKPIYPKLVDCTDDVMAIVKKVTSPIFVTTLVEKLRSRDVKSIGDLAQLSEVEVNRFPFKVPVVPNVFKALDNYYKKNYADKEVSDDKTKQAIGINRSVEGQSSPKRINGFPENGDGVSQVESIKSENAEEDIEKILGHLVKDQEKVMGKMLPAVIKTIGVPKLLQLMCSTCNEEREEKILGDAIAKLTGDGSTDSDSEYGTAPLRSVTDIKELVGSRIEEGDVERVEIIEQCLVPLIKNPNELSGYISELSIAELRDLVVSRVKDEEVDDFLQRILTSYPTQTLKCVVKNNKVVLPSPQDVVETFRCCINDRSKDVQKEVMMDMFRCISDRMDQATLLSLHMEFLNKLRALVEERQVKC